MDNDYVWLAAYCAALPEMIAKHQHDSELAKAATVQHADAAVRAFTMRFPVRMAQPQEK